MSWSKVAIAAVFLLSLPTVVMAQTAGPSTVRVQNNISFFVPAPNDDNEEAQKLRDKARRMIYEMAARECAMLLEILAKDCRLEAVSSNVGRQQFNAQQPSGFTINGSMNLVISTK